MNEEYFSSLAEGLLRGAKSYDNNPPKKERDGEHRPAHVCPKTIEFFARLAETRRTLAAQEEQLRAMGIYRSG